MDQPLVVGRADHAVGERGRVDGDRPAVGAVQAQEEPSGVDDLLEAVDALSPVAPGPLRGALRPVRRLDHGDGGVAGLRQPVGEAEAGRAAADDDHVGELGGVRCHRARRSTTGVPSGDVVTSSASVSSASATAAAT